MTATERTLQDHLYYPIGPTKVVEGLGIRLIDDTGQEYIDCMSGTFNLLLGYAHPEVMMAAREQMDRLAYATSTFQTDAHNDLVQSLVAISPSNLTRVNLRSSGGSEANEGAIKIAQFKTGRRDIITTFRTHLGQTQTMASMSGFSEPLRGAFPHRFPGAVIVPGADCSDCFYRQKPDSCGLLCAERIVDFITYASSGSVAAVFIEPIQGAGGNVMPPEGYLQAIKDICEERDIVLIFDEIQTGFGRTGEFFAADHFGVTPHIMTVAKGMTGSGFPLAAILTEERMTGMAKMMHGYTFGGYNLAAAAAVKTIEIISRPGFLESVRKVGAVLKSRLESLAEEYSFIGEVRGLGLMLGMTIVDDAGHRDPARATAFSQKASEHGLIVRVNEHGRGNVLEIRPALILTDQDAHLIADRFGEVCETLRATS